jgi:hypothetical protein
VWLLNHHNDRRDELVRVDPGDLRVAARTDIGYSISAPAVAEDGSLLVVRLRDRNRPDRPELVRVDPVTNRVAATVALPPASPTYGVTGIVTARGLVWVAYRAGAWSASTRDGDGARGQGRWPAGRVDRLAFAGGWLWAANDWQLHRVDPRDGTVTATVGGPDLRGVLPAAALAGGGGGLWLHGFGPAGEQLVRLDPASGRVQAVSALGGGTGGRNIQDDLGASDRVVAVRSGSRLLLADPDRGVVRAPCPRPGRAPPAWPWTAG